MDVSLVDRYHKRSHIPFVVGDRGNIDRYSSSGGVSSDCSRQCVSRNIL